MPLRFVNKNIIKVPADVIVNPSDGINFKENNISKVITEAGSKAIVFPVLGIGLYGMPYIDALNVAVRAIESYLTVKDLKFTTF